jgi:hypothetical protein
LIFGLKYAIIMALELEYFRLQISETFCPDLARIRTERAMILEVKIGRLDYEAGHFFWQKAGKVVKNMAKTSLFGPFNVNTESIDTNVVGVGSGVYALGHNANNNSVFIVQYVGRSDTDLNDRLKKHLNEGYLLFKYGFLETAKESFNKECQLWHDFGEDKLIDNKIHPDKGINKDWLCPVCGE